MKNKDKTKEEKVEARVCDLIALIHVLEDFPLFDKRLKRFIRDENTYTFDIKDRLYQFTSMESMSKKDKFYLENKSIIDTIKKYTDINEFISVNYYGYGFLGVKNNPLDFFYNYFIKNTDSLKEILAVLTKLDKLGFEKLTFDESADFTKETYSVGSINRRMDYFENIKVFPGYYGDMEWTFITTNSNYHIIAPHEEYSYFRRKIILNNLIFPSSILPDRADFSSLYAKMKELVNEGDCQLVKRAVDLDLAITELDEYLAKIDDIAGGIETYKYKTLLKSSLMAIRREIHELQRTSDEYSRNVTEVSSDVSSKLLNHEKTRIKQKKK